VLADEHYLMRVLAIDIGTSAMKLMRMDGHARVHSVDRVPMTEIVVQRWITALRDTLDGHDDRGEIRGFAVTGQMHGLMTQEADDSWGDGIPWHDTRSAAMIPALRAAAGEDAVRTTGGPLAAGFLGASLAWVRERDPERWKRITRVHVPKDALVHELTGEHVTDPSDAAGTGLYAPGNGDWAWSVVDALGIPHAWLPRVMPSGSIAGGLRPEYAALLGLPRGLPIILAGGDAPTGAYGIGVTRDRDALIMLSTGAQVILPARSWAPDPEGRWYTWPSVAPEAHGYAPFLRTGTLLNAGNVTAWAEDVLAGGTPCDGPSGLLVLPHFSGTREQPEARGGILGLTPRTTAGEIRKALLEGIAFSIRGKREEIAGEGDGPARVRLGGGLAHRPEVRQLFADILGTPVDAVPQPELTAYGAGLLALHNLTGLLPDEVLDSGDIAMPRHARSYETRFALYRDVEAALSPVASRIAATGDERP
jgi:xylulokinase